MCSQIYCLGRRSSDSSIAEGSLVSIRSDLCRCEISTLVSNVDCQSTIEVARVIQFGRQLNERVDSSCCMESESSPIFLLFSSSCSSSSHSGVLLMMTAAIVLRFGLILD